MGALALFVLNPVLRGVVNAVVALSRRTRALSRRVRFRLQRRWRVEAAELIDQLSLFEDVPEDLLSQLAGRVRLRTFRAGQPVVRQGERAEAFYVVRRGVLRVVEERPETGEELRTLRSLGRGEAFGEVGLAEASPRTATVRASNRRWLAGPDGGAVLIGPAGAWAPNPGTFGTGWVFPGADVPFTVERHGRRTRITVKLDPPVADQYSIEELPGATADQVNVRNGWLGK